MLVDFTLVFPDALDSLAQMIIPLTHSLTFPFPPQDALHSLAQMTDEVEELETKSDYHKERIAEVMNKSLVCRV